MCITSVQASSNGLNPDDPISFAAAWLALVPQALCVIYVTLVWASREVELLLMFAGQMGCEALNFVLKRIIQEERPKQMFGKGYGMPSSHAQFVLYFAVYFVLFILFRHVPAYSAGVALSSSLGKGAVALAVAAGAAAVSISRVYLNYHTPKQVLVGSAVGSVCALAWFFVTHYLRVSGWIDWALDLTFARFFRLRDLLESEDLAEAGWQRWEYKRKLKRQENGRSSTKSE